MTRIHLSAAPDHARLDVRAGALVPRLIETRPAYARVALVAGGALLLGGDVVHVSVTVGAGCTLEIEDIGGTVAYNADGESSRWVVDITVEPHALLIWNGLPFIVADGANVDRRTDITLLGRGSMACLRETIVLGRTGETGGRIDLRMTVVAETGADTQVRARKTEGTAWDRSETVFAERLRLVGAEPAPGLLGTNRVMDSVILLGAHSPLDPQTIAVATAAPVPARASAVLELEAPAAIARSLHSETHQSALTPIWNRWSGYAISLHAANSKSTTADETTTPSALMTTPS